MSVLSYSEQTQLNILYWGEHVCVRSNPGGNYSVCYIGHWFEPLASRPTELEARRIAESIDAFGGDWQKAQASGWKVRA